VKFGIQEALQGKVFGDPLEEEPQTSKSKSINSSLISFLDTSPEPILDPDKIPCALPHKPHHDESHSYGNASTNLLVEEHLRHGCHSIQEPNGKDQRQHFEQIENLSIVMSQEWLDEAELSTKIVKLPDHVRRINCNIMGIYGEFCYEPSLGINIIPKSLVLDKSSQEHLSQS
jgi:hypothetical protein